MIGHLTLNVWKLKAMYVLSSQYLFVKDVQKNWNGIELLKTCYSRSLFKYYRELRQLKCTKIRRDPLHWQDYVSVQQPPLRQAFCSFSSSTSWSSSSEISTDSQLYWKKQSETDSAECCKSRRNCITYTHSEDSCDPISVWYSYSNSWSFTG